MFLGGENIVPRHSPFMISLTPAERAELEVMARRYTSPYRDVIRARIVLMAADGYRNDEIAARLN
jgi:DNA-binding CsgD family transcriptional regulator